jgi:hypothetical protein
LSFGGYKGLKLDRAAFGRIGGRLKLDIIVIPR